MTISVNQSVFDKYHEICDYFLTDNNFSRLCTIYYPPIKEACSCIGLAGNVVNNYQWGNPAPFSFDGCNLCGGQGFREKEVTTTIRLRIYWNKRNWLKIGNIAIPNAECQIIGYKSDLPKLLNAQYIKLITEENILEKDYKLSGKPFLHGFGKTRYMIAYLEGV